MSVSLTLRHRLAAGTLEVAFDAPAAGVTALFGPSGAGKSTVLAAVAGLLRPGFCRLTLDGTTIADTASGLWTPPERRRIGLVFQDAMLFPHMNVAANLRYGMRRAAQGKIGFDDVVALLDLARLLDRRPHTLSGGERQRVAIGRALLAQPRLLLLDEPLASLDAARKAEILPFLARLKTALALPMLYVTHALEEVARLADHLVLLRDLRILGSGPVEEMAARADLPLASRDDAGAMLSLRVAAHDPARRLTLLERGAFSLLVPLQSAATGTALRARIPAREVILARQDAAVLRDALSLHNILPARVRQIAEDARHGAAMVSLDADGVPLLSRITPDAVARLGLAPGAEVLALVKSMSVEVLDGAAPARFAG
ncbi:MAG TPA: molybdenum ABC transporter ATP-binding protein [Acetobacteraceae bacterium]|nr:molybdenum ABC transporter ATP-binding protein [Acetobacteraceae bacterium]